MNRKDFIEQQVRKVLDGFGTDQITNEVWNFVIVEHAGILRLDVIIRISMVMYSEITLEAIKRQTNEYKKVSRPNE